MLLDNVIFLVRNEINFIVEAGRTGHDMRFSFMLIPSEKAVDDARSVCN